ncbi:TfoX/Sxy family protein [Aeromicrobium sp.]|uniref:TfoX/Sxy family protein n=1 Tax=Aeromicrobium sp. TaxID=1871063 RepID=UPI003D6B7323
MKMPKPTGADLDHFRSLVPDGPGVEVKAMFGQLAAFVNGNMFAGLFGSAVGVKLAEDAAAVLSALPGAGPFGPEERPMGGYLSIPPDLDDDQASEWIERACEHVATFPPKQKKR